MALNAVQGTMGAGKTYFLVNVLMPDFLKKTKRPIWTNLPIELDTFLMRYARTPAETTEWRERIKFIDDTIAERDVPILTKEGVPAEKDGKPITEKRRISMIREFWWFTDPNSIVILDETADIWNALEHSGRPTTLQAYIRQHRHYKDDLYFCCQDRDDIDIQVRSKILYVYDVTNMKNEPMVPGMALLRGLRWPVVWFRVRVYLGKKVFGRKGELSGFEPIKPLPAIVPSKKGFACYHSHAAANRLIGKKLPSDKDKNEDMETVKERILDWIPNLAYPVACLGGAFMAAWLFLQFIWWHQSGFQGPWWKGGRGGAVAVKEKPKFAVSNSVPVQAVPPTGSNRVDTASTNSTGGNHELQLVKEKILLVTPSKLITDVGEYRVGERVAGLKLERIGKEGCLWGGRYLTWGEFLVCRKRLSCLGGGHGDRRGLQSDGALATGLVGTQSKRNDRPAAAGDRLGAIRVDAQD